MYLNDCTKPSNFTLPVFDENFTNFSAAKYKFTVVYENINYQSHTSSIVDALLSIKFFYLFITVEGVLFGEHHIMRQGILCNLELSFTVVVYIYMDTTDVACLSWSPDME